MPKVKQLSVRVENRPGTLARVARVLGDAKVNILAFLTSTLGAEGSVQVVVDNANKAKKALEGAGLTYTESDVLHVELPNIPGALGNFAGKLAAKGDQYYVRVPDDRERIEEGQRSACGLRPGESSPRSIVLAIDLTTWE